jgi:hypothetical protein
VQINDLQASLPPQIIGPCNRQCIMADQDARWRDPYIRKGRGKLQTLAGASLLVNNLQSHRAMEEKRRTIFYRCNVCQVAVTDKLPRMELENSVHSRLQHAVRDHDGCDPVLGNELHGAIDCAGGQRKRSQE